MFSEQFFLDNDPLLLELASLGKDAVKLIEIIKSVYEKISKSPPLSDVLGDKKNQDKSKYFDLCEERKKLSPNCERVPINWQLDSNGCPTYQSNFHNHYKLIDANLAEMRAGDYLNKFLVIAILAQINELFLECHKRLDFFKFTNYLSWTIIRKDGIEAMFFNDLAIWLSSVLPYYDPKRKETGKLVERWINYCKYVQETIFIHRDSCPKFYDPKYVLSNIIQDLESIHQNISRAATAATFNDHLSELQGKYLEIINGTFNTLFLLIGDGPHDYVLIRNFLNTYDEKKDYKPNPKMKNLIDCLMSDWLYATLNKAGIQSNDFIATNKINYSEIVHHLDFNLENFKNSDLKRTGLWKFAKQDLETTKRFLKKIIQIHQHVLRVCYVYQSISLSSKLISRVGQTWLYCESPGLELLAKMLMVF